MKQDLLNAKDIGSPEQYRNTDKVLQETTPPQKAGICSWEEWNNCLSRENEQAQKNTEEEAEEWRTVQEESPGSQPPSRVLGCIITVLYIACTFIIPLIALAALKVIVKTEGFGGAFFAILIGGFIVEAFGFFILSLMKKK